MGQYTCTKIRGRYLQSKGALLGSVLIVNTILCVTDDFISRQTFLWQNLPQIYIKLARLTPTGQRFLCGPVAHPSLVWNITALSCTVTPGSYLNHSVTTTNLRQRFISAPLLPFRTMEAISTGTDDFLKEVTTRPEVITRNKIERGGRKYSIYDSSCSRLSLVKTLW